MNRLKKRIGDAVWNLLTCGLPRDQDPELLRKLVLLNFIFGLSCFFLFPLGVMAAVQGNYLLFAADVGMGITAIASLWWMRIKRVHVFTTYWGGTLTFFFYAFLVANGGVNQSAFVWGFTFPMIPIFLLGHRKGGVVSMGFIMALAGIFFLGYRLPFIAQYSFDLIVRYVAAYLVVTLFAFIMERARKEFQDKLVRVNADLQKSLEEVKTLSGLLPICSSCKKIRDDKGYWNHLEGYIQRHSDAKFSHGMCPDCLKEYYGSEEWFDKIGKK